MDFQVPNVYAFILFLITWDAFWQSDTVKWNSNRSLRTTCPFNHANRNAKDINCKSFQYSFGMPILPLFL